MDYAWEIVYGLGTVILALALVWGLSRSRNRNRANDPIREAATRAEYESPDAYAEKSEAFKRQARPS
jgi:hypothetical protein